MDLVYLVTGAAGFLGSNVCRQLLERGDAVRAFVLPNDPSLQYFPEDMEVCTGDLCSEKDVERFFTVPSGTRTVCIHCASIVSVNPDFNQKLIDVNVGGTKKIIAAARSHPECGKLVYVSSTIPCSPRLPTPPSSMRPLLMSCCG